MYPGFVQRGLPRSSPKNAAAPLYQGDKPIYSKEWALLVTVKFLPPCKLQFFHGARSVIGYGVAEGCDATWCQVYGASQLHEMQDALTNEPSGFSYHHPATKIASFVLKGEGNIRVRALKVVQVTFAIAETFAQFFAGNVLNPDAIDDT